MSEDVHKNCKAELDRMRLLLQRASGTKKAYRIEMEPSDKGFAIIVTGISAEDEWRFASKVAQYLKVMFSGALRFMAAYAATSVDTKSVEGAARFQAELIDTQPPEPS